MGRWDNLMKFLGHTAESVGDDAVKALEKVDTPELAVSLKDKPREEYLNLLDSIYGSREQRASDLDFSLNPEDTRYIHTNRNLRSGKWQYPAYEPSDARIQALSMGGSNSRPMHNLKKKENAIADKILNLGNSETPEGMDNFVEGRLDQLRKERQNIQEEISKRKMFERYGPPELDSKIDKLREQKIQLDEDFVNLNNQIDEVKSRPLQEVKAVDNLKKQKQDLRDKYNALEAQIKDLQAIAWREAESRGQTIYPVTVKEGAKTSGGDIVKGQDVRSINAAFDPRFKNSKLLMAGGLVGQTPTIDNPIDVIKEGIGLYEEGKKKIADKLASQLDLTKDGSTKDSISSILQMVADPVNVIEGPVGLGLGALQLIGSEDEDKVKQARQNALNRLKGK